MSEEQYDAKIASALSKIGKQCEKLGFSMVAVVEYEPGRFGGTYLVSENASLQTQQLHWLARSAGNIDSFMIAVMRHATKHGHSSAILQQLGVPTTPPDQQP